MCKQYGPTLPSLLLRTCQQEKIWMDFFSRKISQKTKNVRTFMPCSVANYFNRFKVKKCLKRRVGVKEKYSWHMWLSACMTTCNKTTQCRACWQSLLDVWLKTLSVPQLIFNTHSNNQVCTMTFRSLICVLSQRPLLSFQSL